MTAKKYYFFETVWVGVVQFFTLTNEFYHMVICIIIIYSILYRLVKWWQYDICILVFSYNYKYISAVLEITVLQLGCWLYKFVKAKLRGCHPTSVISVSSVTEYQSRGILNTILFYYLKFETTS